MDKRFAPLAVLLVVMAIPSMAQAQASASAPAPALAPVRSPEVHADRTITFRYRDATASQAAVSIDVNGAPQPMEKNADGVWSVTTPRAVRYTSIAFPSTASCGRTRIRRSFRARRTCRTWLRFRASPLGCANVPTASITTNMKTATVLGLENNQSDHFCLHASEL
jgi:enterochelin esterase family protein